MTSEPGYDMKRAIPPLAVLALICLGLVMATFKLTDEKIADNRQRTILRVIGDIIPTPYKNDPLKESIEVTDAAAFGSGRPVNIHVARQGDRVQGFIFMPVTADGYNGPVIMAIGVNRDGSISGVRVIEQNETQGLGNAVDQRVSGWIEKFSGRSFENAPAGKWRVKKDGGDFDQLSGATITSRGVINSVRNTLEYYSLNRQRLLEKAN